MSKSYKYNRSKKPWDIKTLQLRVQDAMKSIEPAFLGEEGVDYDKELIQFRAKISHAYSQLASKHRKLSELKDIEERIKKLEEQNELQK